MDISSFHKPNDFCHYSFCSASVPLSWAVASPHAASSFEPRTPPGGFLRMSGVSNGKNLLPTMAKKPTKPKQKPVEPEKKARVHKELEGFEIGVNPLGEITSNYSIEQINQFLGRHVRDKKIVNREGQYGEEAKARAAAEAAEAEEDEDFPVAEGDEPEEESDEDFMKRTSREAKRKKSPTSEADEAAETRAELPGE